MGGDKKAMMNVLKILFVDLPLHIATSAVKVMARINVAELLTYGMSLAIILLLISMLGGVLHVKEK